MRKILTAAFLFCIVFMIGLIYFFPYSDYISKALEDANKAKDIKINWTNSVNKFPRMILDNVNISSKQGELISLENLKLGFNPISGVTFDGKGRDVTLKGNYKSGKVNFDLKNYSLPAYLSTNVGEGVFDIKGTYDIKANSGKADFSGTIKKIPTPLLTEPLSIVGNVTKTGATSEIAFDAAGKNINGKGNISILEKKGSDSDVSGNIKLKVGMIPLNLRLNGTLGSIKINVGL